MFSDILQISFLQNSVQSYLVSLVIFFTGFLVIKILKGIIMHRLKAWAEKTATSIDDFSVRMVEQNLIPLLYFVALYAALKSLTPAPFLNRGIDITVAVIMTFFGVRFLVALIDYSFRTYWTVKDINTNRQRSLQGILRVIKFLVWAAGLIFFLDNAGFRISTLIAGLGIGGIAVALAAQTILGDLFSYFTISLDRPFETGDFIIVGDFLGTVEHIGLKTTRVRSLGGEQLVFSNTDLTGSRIRNYKKMEKRRVLFRLGLTYQTPLKQLKEIPGIIRDITNDISNTIFDRAHFSSYADFSLVFEVVYYVNSGDYNMYMDIQQEINFRIKEEFEKRGIEFAYPTRTLYIERPGGNA